MAHYEIDVNKKYKIPKEISVVSYDDKFLVIDPCCANWIILQQLSQLDVFNYLASGRTIREATENPDFDHEDVKVVVTQIEARQFCTKKVCSSTGDNRNLHLYLTNKCNLICSHCYMFSGNANSNELTTAEVVKLLFEFRTKANGKYLTLSGGEPSIHVDFDFIVKKASEFGLSVKILTNGSLFSYDRVKLLSKYICSVQVSIDGYSEESNATIRGKGHFTEALRSVDAFISNGVETSIAITPSLELLRSHSNEYIIFAKDLLIKYEGKPFEIKFAESLSVGRNIIPTRIINEEYASLVKKIQDTIYDNQYDLISFVETMSHNVVMDNCMFGNLTVTSNGDVYFCPEIGNLVSIANIRKMPFEVIQAKCVEAEYATRVTQLTPCNVCELLYICGGGCRIKEFPNLVKRNSFEKDLDPSVSSRLCSSAIKERFYKLMVDSNEYLYVPSEDQ